MNLNDMTAPETELADALRTGRTVDLRHRSAEARVVRAGVIVALLTNPSVRPVALRLRGARIVGHVNLGGRRLIAPLELRDCEFTGKIFLAKVHIPELSLRGSRFPHGISARGLRVAGALNLTDCHSDGRLYLKRLRAEIVFLDGVNVTWWGEYAIQLRGAEITQELYCRDGFVSRGRTNLYGARVGGQVVMAGARVEYPQGTALIASNIEVGQDLDMRGITAVGAVKLLKSKIGGDLRLSSAHVSNPGGRSVDVGMAQIGQDLLCDKGFSSDGEFAMLLTHVDGRVDFEEAGLRNPGGVALSANRADIDQSLLLNGVTAQGQVSLDNARISGQVTLNRARVSNAPGTALCGVQTHIGQSLWIDRGARFDGLVDLSNMCIATRFRFTDCQVTTMRATDLSVEILDDDPRCWPDNARITGMHYASLPDDVRGAPRARIAWLARLLPRYAPQPYAQLLSVYRESGSGTAARMVVMARERVRRRHQRNPWRRAISGAWCSVLDVTIGFGFAPWRAIPWIAGFFATAWLLYATAPDGAFVNKDVDGVEVFHPALHAIDSMLPVVQLGSRAQFVAGGGYEWFEALFSCIGWFFGLVVAAGVAGVFRRD